MLGGGALKRIPIIAALTAAVLTSTGCTATATATPTRAGTTAAEPTVPIAAASADAAVPRFDHVVVVVEENHSTSEAMSMRFLGQLGRSGAVFPRSHGVAHPSQPNYLALWSGSTEGVTSDDCPQDLGSAASLGSQLLSAGHSVAAYAQGLPTVGSTVCSAGPYARKHNPLADFSATSGPAHDLPFSAFPSDYRLLPSVSLVIPDLNHDAHDGSLVTADEWLHTSLGGYAAWARTHHSLLIVTFDEEEGVSVTNQILTVLIGAGVRPGTYAQTINHYNLLHTIEASFGLAALGASAAPITGVWQ